MTAVQVQHYLSRARDFLKGMELLKDDLPEFRYSSALLAIHGAISYCDALRIGLGGGQLSSEDHQTAARELRRLLGTRKPDAQYGVDRLEKLLSRKSLVAYFSKRISDKDVVAVVQQTRRFALWAETVGKALKIEGGKMPETATQQRMGRAKNAIQDYLIRKLLYPKVYFDADWSGMHVDILAIDRTGVGDVHAVRLLEWEAGHRDNHGWSSYLEKKVPEAMKEFVDFLGQYRYVAVVCMEPKKQRWIPAKPSLGQSLAADGAGRVGILYVDMTEEDPSVQVLLKPERFRSSKQIAEIADRYIASNQANWELRE